jgi:hypothetical protein
LIAPPSGRRTRSDEVLHPLAAKASRKKKLITADPPLKDITASGFILGDRNPSLPPCLRPLELKEKEKKLYLDADPAE